MVDDILQRHSCPTQKCCTQNTLSFLAQWKSSWQHCPFPRASTSSTLRLSHPLTSKAHRGMCPLQVPLCALAACSARSPGPQGTAIARLPHGVDKPGAKGCPSSGSTLTSGAQYAAAVPEKPGPPGKAQHRHKVHPGGQARRSQRLGGKLPLV